MELVSSLTLAKEQFPFRNFAIYLLYFQNHCHLTFVADFFHWYKAALAIENHSGTLLLFCAYIQYTKLEMIKCQ